MKAKLFSDNLVNLKIKFETSVKDRQDGNLNNSDMKKIIKFKNFGVIWREL